MNLSVTKPLFYRFKGSHYANWYSAFTAHFCCNMTLLRLDEFLDKSRIQSNKMAAFFFQNITATVFFVPYLISLWSIFSSKDFENKHLLPNQTVFTVCTWTTICAFFVSVLMVARWQNTFGLFLKNHDHLRPLPLIGMLSVYSIKNIKINSLSTIKIWLLQESF